VPFAYLRDPLVQLSHTTPPAVASLLPDGWLAAHPDGSPVPVAVAGRTNAALSRS